LSLVELLVALAISAALMLPLVQMQATAASGVAIVRTRLETEREADFALERIVARVRATPASPLTPNASADTSGSWFGGVSFLRIGQQLVERSNGVDSVLADSVTDFSITAPVTADGPQLVQVSLTLAQARSPSAAQAMSLASAGATVTADATVRMGSGL
jgi:hypothetical protein